MIVLQVVPLLRRISPCWATRVHVVVARRAEVHVAPCAGGLPAGVAPAAGARQAGEGELVAGVPVQVHQQREAQTSLVDVEGALVAAVAGARDCELARGARMRGCLAVVVPRQQVLWVEEGALDSGTISCHRLSP